MMRRHFEKPDASQAEIVETLRAVGAMVFLIGRPFDLLVAWRGSLLLGDCKTPGIGRWTPAQLADIARFKRHGITVHRWETPRDALASLGCGGG